MVHYIRKVTSASTVISQTVTVDKAVSGSYSVLSSSQVFTHLPNPCFSLLNKLFNFDLNHNVGYEINENTFISKSGYIKQDLYI